MAKNTELAKTHAKAFHERDENTIRDILHPNYTFVGPSMVLNSPDESVEFMKNMPMVAKTTNSRYIEQGDLVTHVFDLALEQPFEKTIRMCEVLTIKENKILKIELYFDSADMPSKEG